MARFIADDQGKVHIQLATDDPDEQITFAIESDQDVLYTPGQAVEIDDARLERVIYTLLTPLPFGGVRRVEL